MEPLTNSGPGTGGTEGGAAAPVSGAPDHEKILRAAESLAGKHGGASKSSPEQRERWRLQKQRQAQSKVAGSVGVAGAAPPPPASDAPAPADPALDPELIRACLRAGIDAADDLVKGAVFRRCMSVSADDRSLSLSVSSGCAVGEGRRKLLVETGTAVLQKYSLVGGYFPEIALVLGLGSWAVQVRHAFSRLDELENRIREAGGSKPPTPKAE